MADVVHSTLSGSDLHEGKTLVVSGAPVTIPLYIGQGRWDQSNKKFYVAVGTTASTDWQTTDIVSSLTEIDTATINITLSGGANKTIQADVNLAAINIPASQITDFNTAVSANSDVAANTAARHSALSIWSSGPFSPNQTGRGLELETLSQTIRLSQDLSATGTPTFASINTTSFSSGNVTVGTGGTPQDSSLFRTATDGLVARGVSGSTSDLTLEIGGGTVGLRLLTGTAQLQLPTLSTGILHSSASGSITSSLIVDADVHAAAAIAGTKISPDFGSQNVVTTGTYTGTSLDRGSAGALTIAGTNATTLNLGTSSTSQVINVGTGANGTVNIGSSGSIVNILGAVFVTPAEYVSTDKDLILNYNASGQSGQNTGILVQEQHTVALSLTQAQWQSGNTVRYFSPNTQSLASGEYIRITGFTNSPNNGTFIVTAVNANVSFDVTNLARSSAADDETNPATGARLLIAGYNRVTSDRLGWTIKAPGSSGQIKLTPMSSAFTLNLTSAASTNVTATFNQDVNFTGAFTINIDQTLSTTDSPSFTGLTVSGNTLNINSNNELHLNDSDNSDYVALKSASTSATYTIAFPAAAPVSGTYLKNTGVSTYSWANAVDTVGAFQATSTADGLSISTNSIRLHAADGTNPGAVSTVAQTFAGTKTFNNQINILATTAQLVLGTGTTTTLTAPAPSSSRLYTIPDVGSDSFFILSAGTQTLSGAKTFSTAVSITPTTDQLVLGTTTTVTLNAPTPASSATYTIPDVGTTASFVMTAGTQTIGGSKTLSSALTINPTTNQLVLGVTNTTTINSTAPAASRTYTIPDAGTNTEFILGAGTQTIGGSKTFSSALTINPTSNQLILGVTNTTTINASAPAASRTYTIPDTLANSSFVMTDLAQTINDTKTFTSALLVTPVTNQLVLGTTNTVTINAAAPVASRTYTIPDTLANSSFVMTDLNQTINGIKTFTNAVTINGANVLNFYDSDSSNFAAIRAPNTVNSNYTLQLPADGNSGIRRVLQFDSTNVGSFVRKFSYALTTTQTTTYSVALEDELVPFNSSSGGFTITLPASASFGLGNAVIIVDAAGQAQVPGNQVTIATTGGQTINGSSTITMDEEYGARTFVAVSAGWLLV